ncbi:MAG: hypothetical protein FGF52_06420 [Candidatus Brockarchaeota archaeon]|nr:hypothetical protein [Candidatus Brockarchaeota archaeon]
MGQLSAELNYERRLERYEEDVEKHILNSENWEGELERYLEEIMEEIEGHREKFEGEVNKEYEEYEDHSAMAMAANLSEDEKQEEGHEIVPSGVLALSKGEECEEKGHEIITSEGLVLLRKPEEREEKSEIKELFPALEMGDYLRDLEVEGIEVPVEEPPEMVERPENLTEEKLGEVLKEEGERQEELYREALFEVIAREIEKKAESEGPLERLFEGVTEFEGIGGPSEGLAEESGLLEKGVEEPTGEAEEGLVESEEPLGEVIESLKEVTRGIKEEEALEEEVEELIEEGTEEPAEEFVEEVVERKVEESIEEEVEGLVEEGAEEAIEEEALEEKEADEVAGESVEKVSEEVTKEAEEEEGETEELVGEGGEPPEGQPEVVAAGEERPERGFEDVTEEKVIYRSNEVKVSKDGTIQLGEGFESDKVYWVRVKVKTEKGEEIIGFSAKKEQCGKFIPRVPNKHLEKLHGKKVEVEVVPYNRKLHFRWSKAPDTYFDPKSNLLVIKGKRIKVMSSEGGIVDGWSKQHRAYVKLLLAEKDVERGARAYLVLYEDGSFSIRISEYTREIKELIVEGNLLKIKHPRGKLSFPIETEPWEEVSTYKFRGNIISVEGGAQYYPLMKLREIYGYDAAEKILDMIRADKLEIIAEFDGGRRATCHLYQLKGSELLVIDVPPGAKELRGFTFQPPPKFGSSWTLEANEITRLQEIDTDVELGNFGRDKAKAVIEAGGVSEIGMDIKNVFKEVYLKDSDRHVDIVVEKSSGLFEVVEVKTTRDPDHLRYYLSGAIEELTSYREDIVKQGGLVLEVKDAAGNVTGTRIIESSQIEDYVAIVLHLNMKTKIVDAMVVPLGRSG